MPKRTDIHKVLVIGSGPIVIGQAAEFDYAGTQACLALREEGYEVILVNSNPATIMTDTSIADKVYMEPLTLEYVARICRFERPDAIVPGIGGQTGLNLAMQLSKKGVLQECEIELLGTDEQSIETAEDRELFKELCQRIGEPVVPSQITYSVEDALEAVKQIGYPVILRPAFTLGGTGGGFASNEDELRSMMKNALALSPVRQVLVEKSIKGYKEIEFEVMRDANDTAITVCSMENLDPVGIHTGDSIVVAPCQTLCNREYQMLRDSALKIIRALNPEKVMFGTDYPVKNPAGELERFFAIPGLTEKEQEEVWRRLVEVCMACDVPYAILFQILRQRGLQIQPDGEITFSYCLDLRNFEAERSEEDCATVCAEIILELMEMSKVKDTPLKRLLQEKCEEDRYGSFAELFQDIISNSKSFKRNRKENGLKRALRSVINNKDKIVKILIVLCVLLAAVAVILTVSQLKYGEIPILRLFQNTFQTIGTEKLVQ